MNFLQHTRVTTALELASCEKSPTFFPWPSSKVYYALFNFHIMLGLIVLPRAHARHIHHAHIASFVHDVLADSRFTIAIRSGTEGILSYKKYIASLERS